MSVWAWMEFKTNDTVIAIEFMDKGLCNLWFRYWLFFGVFLFPLMTATHSLAENTVETPPFRAWWPIVNKELEAGTRGFVTQDDDPVKDNQGLQKYGFGVGFTDRFFVELEGHLKRREDGHYHFSAYEIESRFEITQTKAFNEIPNLVDVGVLVGLKLPKYSGDAYEMEARLLLYKRAGPIRTTFNLIFEQEFGNNNSQQLEVAYANQIRYRLTPNVQPGVEFFGRFGEVGSFSYSNGQHNFGPGVFGFIELSDGFSLKYEFTYLVGISGPTPSQTFKWLTEFEHKF